MILIIQHSNLIRKSNKQLIQNKENNNYSSQIQYVFIIIFKQYNKIQILTKQLNELKLLTSCQTTKSNRYTSQNQINTTINNMSLNNITMNKGSPNTNNNNNSNNDLSKYIKYQKKLINDSNIYQNQNDSNQDQDQDQEDISSSIYNDQQSDDTQMNQFANQEEYNENQKENVDDHQEDKNNQSLTLNNKQQRNNVSKHNMTLNLGGLGKSIQQNDVLLKAEQKPKFSVPKLQLAKAKQIQTLIVKKINNDQKKKKQSQNGKKNVIQQQKYKKLQDQLQNLRKKLGHQMIQKLKIQRQLIFLKRMISQLQQRNMLLVQAKKTQQEQDSYLKKRKNHQEQNQQSLLDICRDVTLNQRLRLVVMGKQQLSKKEGLWSYQC